MKKLFLFAILYFVIKLSVACHAVTLSEVSATDNGDGTFTYVFQACMGTEDTWGFWMDFTGANIVSISPGTLTGTHSTVSVSDPPVSGNGDLEYGDFDNTGGTKFSEGTSLECFNITVTFDGPITAAYLENDQENVASNCNTTIATSSCFPSTADYAVSITTYGPCNGPFMDFDIDGSTVYTASQDGSTSNFMVCGSCSSSIEVNALAGTSGSPGSRCPGGVASYTVTNGDGSVTYGSGGGDNNTNYVIGAPGCPLSIDLISFFGENEDTGNKLIWNVASEIDNSLFVLERSKDNVFWDPIAIINGAGNSDEAKQYLYTDNTFENQVNYYRIKDIDIYGVEGYSHSIVIDNTYTEDKILVDTYNILGQPVNSEFEGFVIDVYSDGTSVKRFNTKGQLSLEHH